METPVGILTFYIESRLKFFIKDFPYLDGQTKRIAKHNTLQQNLQLIQQHIIFMETPGNYRGAIEEALDMEDDNNINSHRNVLQNMIVFSESIQILNNNSNDTIYILNSLNNIKQLLHF